MRCAKKRDSFIPGVLITALLLILCAACESVEDAPRKPSPVHEAKSGDELAREAAEREAARNTTPEPTFQVSVLDTMIKNGEITEYWEGDELNVVYKYVPSTFDSEQKFLVGVVDNNGNFVVGLNEENTWFLTRMDKICEVHHLGNDIFSTYDSEDGAVYKREIIDTPNGTITGNKGLGCGMNIYNAKTNTASILWATHEDRGDTFFTSEAINNIYEGFSDGVIVTTEGVSGWAERGIYIQLIFDDGTVARTSIYTKGEYFFDSRYYIVGKYSEGMFFYDRKFYNIDGECVIDCSEYAIQYGYGNVPMFENGKCHLRIYKNEKLWDTYIDTSGNFIGEPTEYIDEMKENE